MKRSGYTLPVFAIAAARAAILTLQGKSCIEVTLDLWEAVTGTIAIAQSARIDERTALAITTSDPGDNLDLTAGTPVWAWVQIQDWQGQPLVLEGGEGIGHSADGAPAIYSLARKLADANLLPLMSQDRTMATSTVVVRFVLPEGRSLAERTSNAAFGILEGLSLLGTSAISQPLSVEEKLEDFRAELQCKAATHKHLALYIGALGQQVAQRAGFIEAQTVQAANWLGVLLVEAALLDVEAIAMVGYHGKLLKLAGGIFNTSSHLADARLEILTTAAVRLDFPPTLVRQVTAQLTADAVHQLLVGAGRDREMFAYLSTQIRERASAYVRKYAHRDLAIDVLLCDRRGHLLG